MQVCCCVVCTHISVQMCSMCTHTQVCWCVICANMQVCRCVVGNKRGLYFILFGVLGIEPEASFKLGKLFTTGLYLQPQSYTLFI